MFRLARFAFCLRITRSPPSGGVRLLLPCNFHRAYCKDRFQSLTNNSDDLDELDDQNYDLDLERTYLRFGMWQGLKELIESCGNKIDWNEIIKKGLSIPATRAVDREAVKAQIVLVCEKEQMFDALNSYCRYLVENKELCAGMLFLICSAINSNQDKLKECTKMVYEIFLKLPKEQKLPLHLCCSVLINSKEYKKKIGENNGVTLPILKERCINKSLENNNFEDAFQNIKLVNSETVYSLLPTFLTYFQTVAEKGELPFSEIVTFFDHFLKIKLSGISDDIINQLEKLTSTLNSHDKYYKWSFTETKFEKRCYSCNEKLEKVDVTQEEIEILKDNIEKNVIFGKNIYIRSTSEEWKVFVTYLKKKCYDIVLDGLNIMHSYLKDPQLFSALLKDLERLELIPLIIGRKHFFSTPEYHMVRKKYPVFLTQDLSDDDVFVLYATLDKGKNCYFTTNDQMGFTRTYIDSPEIEDIFVRWQASHQAYATKTGLILPHGLGLGWQKAPLRNQNEFIYHLAMKQASYRKLYCFRRMKRLRGKS